MKTKKDEAKRRIQVSASINSGRFSINSGFKVRALFNTYSVEHHHIMSSDIEVMTPLLFKVGESEAFSNGLSCMAVALKHQPHKLYSFADCLRSEFKRLEQEEYETMDDLCNAVLFVFRNELKDLVEGIASTFHRFEDVYLDYAKKSMFCSDEVYPRYYRGGDVGISLFISGGVKGIDKRNYDPIELPDRQCLYFLSKDVSLD